MSSSIISEHRVESHFIGILSKLKIEEVYGIDEVGEIDEVDGMEDVDGTEDVGEFDVVGVVGKVFLEGEEKRNARGSWHCGLYIATVFDKIC
jgi:hypothetical protein